MYLKIINLLPLLFFTNITLAQSNQAGYPETASQLEQFHGHELLGFTKHGFEQNKEKAFAAKGLASDLSATVFHLNAGCTGFFISNQGHALTALHCLRLYSYDSYEVLFFKTPPDKQLSYLKSKLTFENRILNLEDILGAISVGVIKGGAQTFSFPFLGKGTPSASSNWYDADDLTKFGFNSIDHPTEDFALIKFNTMPKGYTCAQIDLNKPRENSLIWSFGYPAYVDKPQYKNLSHSLNEALRLGKETWGEDFQTSLNEFMQLYDAEVDQVTTLERLDASRSPLYLSVGRFFTKFSQLREYSPLKNFEGSTYENLYPEDRSFFTSALVGPGMSGGPVFNTEGKVLGLNLAGPISSMSFFQKGLGLGGAHQSIKFVYDAIEGRKGVLFTEEAFDCSKF